MEMDERTPGAGHEAFPYGTFAMADTFLLPNQTPWRTEADWSNTVEPSTETQSPAMVRVCEVIRGQIGRVGSGVSAGKIQPNASVLQ